MGARTACRPSPSRAYLWTFFQTLRKIPEAQHRTFVVTTVNKRVLDRRVGPTDAIEIQGGHADDFYEVIDAVDKAVRASHRL